jgi:hypothetical protein
VTAPVRAAALPHVTLGSFAALRMTGVSTARWNIVPVKTAFCFARYWFLQHPNPYKLR